MEASNRLWRSHAGHDDETMNESRVTPKARKEHLKSLNPERDKRPARLKAGTPGDRTGRCQPKESF